MKKFISFIIVLTLMIGYSSAFAADMSVQMIGCPVFEQRNVSLDDIQLEDEIKIEDFGVICPTEFSYIDSIHKYGGGRGDFKSGKEAEYAVLRMDILNTLTKSKDYLSNCEVKIIYDGEYEYAGWCYQYNYDKSETDVLDLEDYFFAIEPMYEGHYIFGGTIPNAIVDSKKPLRMEIIIDGNKITYNIRK